MTGFSQHTGRFIPLDVANVDTDAIIPKQFLQKITRAGFGQHLFHDWRFLNDDATQPNPDFVLNKPAYKGARILLTRANFGCGSSREHAPWALSDYGFQVIIAPSFADIFYNNAFNSALLPVQLTEEEIDSLFRLAAEHPMQELTVDLEAQTVKAGENGPTYHFKIDPFRRDCLLHGLDTIGLTLKLEEEIVRYEAGKREFLKR